MPKLIVGVACKELFAPYLLVDGGYILVERMKDGVFLILHTTKVMVVADMWAGKRIVTVERLGGDFLRRCKAMKNQPIG